MEFLVTLVNFQVPQQHKILVLGILIDIIV